MSESAPTSTAPWTTRRLLAWMTERFEAKEVDAPRIVAEMLLAHVLGCERITLYMEADRPASAGELETLRGLVVRASGHEPVQYLTGRVAFYGAEFLIDASTLIPQPCTEDLIELAIERLAERIAEGATSEDGAGLVAADIGTGAGCIAVCLARRFPGLRVVATDIVQPALELARRNAERFEVESRIEFVAGSGCSPLAGYGDGGRFDIICSNPPYISDAEWAGGEIDRCVRDHVPPTATRGGVDGLDVLRPLIAQAGARLRPNASLVVEIGAHQRDAVLGLVDSAPDLVDGDVRADSEGHWRVAVARSNG